jgi:hypothetical protein
LADTYVQQRRLRNLDKDRLAAKMVGDAWCAAFVQEKTKATRPHAITEAALHWIGSDELTSDQLAVLARVNALAERYQFFHWHVEFPHIFTVPDDGSGVDPATGWRGGFSCVLGNPPWERVKLQEQEFFAARRPDIAGAKNAAARKKMIAALAKSEDELDRKVYDEFQAELRLADGWSHLLRVSGRHPLTGRGDINTYAVFAETGRTILAPKARVGMVLPTGIATDATTQYFFKDLVRTRTLASIYDFENEEKVFPGITNRVRFCLWSVAGKSSPTDRISLAFVLRQPHQISDRRYTLTPDEITLLNPNAGTCPVFDHKRSAEVTLTMYRHVGSVLWLEEPEDNPWRLSFLRMLDMANDSDLFHDRDDLEQDAWAQVGNVFERAGERMLPLYEAKMVHQFDHRFATYEDATQAQLNKGTLPRTSIERKADPNYAILPHYWVQESEVDVRLGRKGWDKEWLLGWRDMCRSSDTRTLIASFIPLVGVGHKFLLALPDGSAAALEANLSSFVLDFIARQKIAGSSMSYMILKQLPLLPPQMYEQPSPWDVSEMKLDWIVRRVLELSYTTYDMAGFARNHGDNGPPFGWDEVRRFWLRAELDAAYFHLYGVPHDDVDYIMDTFRAFRNNEPDRFARTKQAILDVYDDMAKATDTGESYRTKLDPPPGHGPRHPARPSGGDRT